MGSIAAKDGIRLHYEEYGGAPMLGIKKLVVKTHGNSKAPEIRNTILQCSKAVTEDLTGKIERTFYGI